MNKEVRVLWLSQEEAIASGARDMAMVLEQVEKVNVWLTYGDDRCVESVSRIFFDKPKISGHRIATHAALIRNDEMRIFGIKGIPSNPENPKLYGMPRSNGLMIMYHEDTVLPFAVMDDKIVSDMRTGAGGALGAKYLANADSEVLGLVGCGPIQDAHIEAVSLVAKNIKIVRLFDLDEKKAHLFAERWQKLGYRFEVATSCEAAIADADIVFTCTTVSVGSEYIPAEWVKKGSFHCPSSIWDYKPETVVSAFDRHAINFEERLEDEEFPLYHHLKDGELKREQIQVIGKIIRGVERCRTSREDTVYYSTLGICATDLAINHVVYSRARELGLGTEVYLWREPAYF